MLICIWLSALHSKADTAAKNLDGKTALEVATLKNETEVVKLLQDAADKEATPTPTSS